MLVSIQFITYHPSHMSHKADKFSSILLTHLKSLVPRHSFSLVTHATCHLIQGHTKMACCCSPCERLLKHKSDSTFRKSNSCMRAWWSRQPAGCATQKTDLLWLALLFLERFLLHHKSVMVIIEQEMEFVAILYIFFLFCVCDVITKVWW